MLGGKDKKMQWLFRRDWSVLLRKLPGEKVQIIGSSRTDAGVHAKGYTGNFYTR